MAWRRWLRCVSQLVAMACVSCGGAKLAGPDGATRTAGAAPIEGHLCKLGDRAACTTACEGKNWGSCVHLGLMYEGGRGVDRDEARAAALYRQACDAGEPRGCGDLGF